MKLLQDLLFTDYGLMSLIGIVFMLGMMVFFLRLFLRGREGTIEFGRCLSLAERRAVVPLVAAALAQSRRA